MNKSKPAEKKSFYWALALYALGLVLGTGGMLIFSLFRSRLSWWWLLFVGSMLLLVWDLWQYRKALDEIPSEKGKGWLRSFLDEFSGKV